MFITLAPKEQLWAALDPFTNYCGGSDTSNLSNPSSQQFQLILSDENRGPVEVKFDEIPTWAQEQIQTSIKRKILLTSESPEQFVPMETKPSDSKPESPDFGLLAKPTLEIKREIRSEDSREVLDDLLNRERKGLNRLNIPRTGVIIMLEEQIKKLESKG